MRQASRKLQTNGFWTHVYYDRFADFGQHYALFEFDTFTNTYKISKTEYTL